MRASGLKGMSRFSRNSDESSNQAEIKASLSEILEHCDYARSFTAQKLGIQINDIKGGNSVWFPLDKNQ